jgi:hypothetical protein
MEISSATPEAAEFQGMDEAAIDAQLDAIEGKAETSAEVKPQDSNAEPKVKEGPAEKPAEPSPWEAKIAELEKRLTATSKETGQIRAMNARLDKLQSMTQTQKEQLTPEQQTQQQAFEAYLKRQIEAYATEKYGPLLTDAQQAREVQAYGEDFKSLVNETGLNFDDVKGIASKIVQEITKLAANGDESAIAKRDMILNHQGGGHQYLLNLTMAEHYKQIAAKGQQFADGKSQAAQAASRTMLKGGNVQSGGKKSLAEMTQAEMAKLSEKDIDAALDEAGVR